MAEKKKRATEADGRPAISPSQMSPAGRARAEALAKQYGFTLKEPEESGIGPNAPFRSGKKVIATRPGQILVVDIDMTVEETQSVTARGWIINDGAKVGMPVGVQQAIKQGYWVEPTGGEQLPAGVVFPDSDSPATHEGTLE